jgi:ribosomal protein S27AE
MNKAEEILEKHTLWQGEKAVRTEEDMLLAMEEYAEWKLKNCNLQNVVGRSEQLCPRCKSPLIYKRVHTDGYSCSNCFHDWA